MDYDKTLARIVKGAEYLDNPLLTDFERDKAQQLFDLLDLQIRAYKERLSDGVTYLTDQERRQVSGAK